MKKSRTLCIAIPLSCFTLNAIAAATWVDNRYAHTTASEKNQYKIGLGHIFDNGAGVLASAMYDLGQDFNQMKSSFQEFEGWYPLPLNEKWTLTPGGLTDIDNKGTKLAPYISLDYKISKTLSFSSSVTKLCL